MVRLFFRAIAMALALGASSVATAANDADRGEEIGLVEIGSGMTLRRITWRNPDPKGYVLLLHGFPETAHAWEGVATRLSENYEVHAFDWPGYGLSSRPPTQEFGYAPRDYARVLKDYLAKSGIDRSRLTIYATDIGALPVLLLALEEPAIARTIIVGDFAPFDRPHHMYPTLQGLKSTETAGQIRAQMNKTRDEILANTFYRGLADDSRFEISEALRKDLRVGWDAGGMTSADAFYQYYSRFTRDQNHFEANAAKLLTPVKVLWGEHDLYISKEMGAEFAERVGAELILLRGIGHYPHLQDPAAVVDEIHASFR